MSRWRCVSRSFPSCAPSHFENAPTISSDVTVPQYLGRLVTNAVTITNARDYGRVIHDLATRRELILIAQDTANAAYDAPVDFPPKEQVEEVERRLYALAEAGKYGKAFAPSMKRRIRISRRPSALISAKMGFQVSQRPYEASTTRPEVCNLRT